MLWSRWSPILVRICCSKYDTYLLRHLPASATTMYHYCYCTTCCHATDMCENGAFVFSFVTSAALWGLLVVDRGYFQGVWWTNVISKGIWWYSSTMLFRVLSWKYVRLARVFRKLGRQTNAVFYWKSSEFHWFRPVQKRVVIRIGCAHCRLPRT